MAESSGRSPSASSEAVPSGPWLGTDLRPIGTLFIDTAHHVSIEQEDAVEATLEMLTEGDAAAQRDGLWILWKLSQGEQSRSEIRLLGGLEILIDWLGTDSVDIQKLSLRILCNLSFEDESASEIRKLGGIAAILDSLANSIDGGDIEITRVALRTLCNLSINDMNKIEIRLQGGLDPISKSLLSEDIRTRRDALRTVCNLSINVENKMKLRSTRGLNNVIDCLKVEDAETQRYALASLINLCSDEENEAEVRKSGGLDEILFCTGQTLDLESRRFGLRCLCNLAIGDENRTYLGRIGALSRLLSFLTDEDLEIRCYALATLMHMCSDQMNNSAVQSFNGIRIVLDALQSREVESKRYALGALSVMSMDAKNRNAIENASGIPLLLRGLSSKDFKTRKHALKAIYHFVSNEQLVDEVRTNYLPSLVEFLDDTDPDVQKMSFEVLIRCTSDNSRGIRSNIRPMLPSTFISMMNDDERSRSSFIEAMREEIESSLREMKEREAERKMELLAERDAIQRQLEEDEKMMRTPGDTRASLSSLRVPRPQSASDKPSGGRGREEALDARIAVLEDTNTQLEEINLRLRNENSNFTSMIHSKDEKIRVLETSLREAESNLSRMKSEGSSDIVLLNEIDAKSIEISSLKSEQESYQAEIQVLRREKRELMERVESSRQKVDILEREIQSLSEVQPPSPIAEPTTFQPPSSQHSDGEFEVIHGELQLARRTIASIRKELTDAYEDARESREREKQGEEKLRALQEELSLLQQSRSMDDLQVQKTISDLSGTVEALRREIGERNLSLPLVSGLEERIVTYSQQLRMSFDEIHRLQAEVAEFRQCKFREEAALERIRVLQSELDAIQVRQFQSEKDLRDASDELVGAFQRLEKETSSSQQFASDLRRIQDEHDLLRERVMQLSSNLKDERHISERLSAELALSQEREREAGTKIRLLQDEIGKREQLLDRSEETNRVLSEEADRTLNQLRSELDASSPLHKTVRSLEEQIHRYKNEHAWTERDLRDCRRLISEYEVSIADLRDREATATNRLLVLQREVLLRDHQMESSDAKYSSVSSSLSEKEDLISQLQMKLKDSVQMFADAEKRAMKAEGEAARLRLALKESQDSLSSSTQLSSGAETKILSLEDELQKELEDSRQIRNEMSDTIEKLQLRVRDLEQCEVDLSVFREEVSRMSRASETYQRNLRSAEEKISSLEKRLDSYFDIEEREHQALLRIQSLEDELRHRDSDLFAQESKVAEVEKSLVSETRDHSTDRLRLFDLDRELRDVKRELDSRNVEAIRLRSEMDVLIHEKQDIVERESLALARVQSLERENSLLQSTVDRMSSEVERAQTESDKLLDDLRESCSLDFANKIDELRKSINERDMELRRRQSHIQRLEDQLKKMDDEVKTLRDLESAASVGRRNAEKEIDLLFESSKHEINSKDSALCALREQLDACAEAARNNEDMSSTLVESQHRLKILERELSSRDTEIASLKRRLSSCELELSEEHDREVASVQRVRYLENELELLRNISDDSSQKLADQSLEVDLLYQRISSVSGDAKEYESIASEFKAELERSQHSFHELQRTCSSLERENVHLRNSLSSATDRERSSISKLRETERELALLQSHSDHERSVLMNQISSLRQEAESLYEMRDRAMDAEAQLADIEHAREALQMRIRSLQAQLNSAQNEKKHVSASIEATLEAERSAEEHALVAEKELRVLEETSRSRELRLLEQLDSLRTALFNIRDRVRMLPLSDGVKLPSTASDSEIVEEVNLRLDDLSNSCKMRIQEVTSLRKQISSLEEAIDELRDQESVASKHAHDMELEFQLLSNSHERVLAEKEKHLLLLSERLEHLSQEKLSSEELQSVLESLQEEIGRFSKENEMSNSLLRQREEMIANCTRENQRLQDLYTAARARVQTLEVEIDALVSERESLAASVPEEVSSQLQLALREKEEISSLEKHVEEDLGVAHQRILVLEQRLRLAEEKSGLLEGELAVCKEREKSSSEHASVLSHELAAEHGLFDREKEALLDRISSLERSIESSEVDGSIRNVLERRCQELDHERTRLSSELISLRSSKSSLEEEIQALKVALEEARLEESSAADHCAHLERELALLKRTSDDAAVAHRQAQEELQTITENSRNHMMLSEENRGLLDDLDGKLQTYATRLASAEALVQQLTEQLALCESRSAAFENESKQGASRVRELLSELELLSKRNAELETQCRTEEEEITHLRSVIREEEACLESVESKYQSSLRDRDQVYVRLQDEKALLSRISSLETELEESRDREQQGARAVALLKEELSLLKRQVDFMEADTSLSMSSARLESEKLKNALASVSEQAARVSEVELADSALQAELQVSRRQVIELEERLLQTHTELRLCSERESEGLHQITILRHEMDLLRSEEEKEVADRDERICEMSASLESISRTASNADEALHTIVRLQRDLDSQSRLLRDTEQKLSSSELQLRNSRDELVSANNLISHLRDELDRLQQSAEQEAASASVRVESMKISNASSERSLQDQLNSLHQAYQAEQNRANLLEVKLNDQSRSTTEMENLANSKIKRLQEDLLLQSKTFTGEIHQLEGQLSRTQTELEQVRLARDQLNDERTRLVASLARAEDGCDRNAQLGEEIQRMDSYRLELEGDLEAARTKIVQLESELQLQSTFFKMRIDEYDADSQMLKQSHALASSKSSEQYEKKIEALEDRLAKAHMEAEEERTRLEKTVVGLEGKLADANYAIRELQSVAVVDARSAEDKVGILSDELDTQAVQFERERNELLEELRRINQELTQKKKEIFDLRDEIRENEAQSRRRNTISLQTDAIVEKTVSRRDYDDVNQRVLELDRELKNVTAHHDSEMTTLEERLRVCSELRERAEDERNKLAARLKEVPQLESRVRQLERENNRLQETADLALGDSARERILAYEKELSAQSEFASREKDVLADELTHLKKDLELAELRLSEKDSELSSIRSSIDRASQYSAVEMDAMFRDREQLRGEVSELKSRILQLDDAETHIRTLRNEFLMVSRSAEEERDHFVRRIEGLEKESTLLQVKLSQAQNELTKIRAMKKLDEARLHVSSVEKIETATISASEKVSLLKRELEEQQRFSQVQMETAEKEISRLLTELESASSYREKSETLSEEVNRLNLRLRENIRKQFSARLDNERASEERVSLLERELQQQELFAHERIEEMNQRIRDLEGMLAVRGQKQENLQTEVVDRLRQDIVRLKGEAASLKAELASSHDTITILRKELDQMNRFHEHETQHLQMKLAAVLREKNMDASAVAFVTVKDFEDAKSSWERERASIQKDKDVLQSEYVRLMRDKQEVESRMLLLREERDAATYKVRELESEMSKQSSYTSRESGALSSTNISLREEVERLQCLVDEQNKQFASERSELQRSLITLRERCQEEVLESQRMNTERIRVLENELRQQGEFAEAASEERQERHRSEMDGLREKYEREIQEMRASIQAGVEKETSLQREKVLLLAENNKLKGLGSGGNSILNALDDATSSSLSQLRRPVTAPSSAPASSSMELETPTPVVGPSVAWGTPDQKVVSQQQIAGLIARMKKSVGDEQELAMKQLTELGAKESGVRVEIRRQGGLRVLVKAVANDQFPGCVLASLKLINVLCMDDRVEEEIRKVDGIDPVVQLLAATSNSDLLVASLSLIRSLSVSDENERIIISYGVIPYLVNFAADRSNSALRREAVKCLRSLSFAGDSKNQVRESGGIGVLLDCLRDPDPETQKGAIRALMVLSISPENRVEIRSSHGIPVIVESLHSSDIDVRRSAAGTLINLSVNGKNKKQIREHGGISALVHCLEFEDVETRRYSIRTLSNMTISEDNRDELVRLGGIGNVLSLLTVEDTVTTRFASKTLAQLSAVESHCEEIVRRNGLVSILTAVTSRDSETVREALTVVSQLLRFEETVKEIKRVGYVTRIARLFLQHATSRSDSMQYVKMQLLAIVAELSSEDDVRPELVKLGLVRTLIEVLGIASVSRDVDTQINSSVCLSNLTTVEQAKIEFRKLGGIEQLVSSLKQHLPDQLGGSSAGADSDVFLAEVLKIVQQIGTVDKNRTAFMNLGGLPYLLRSLDCHNVDIVRSATRALHVLSVDDEIEAEVCRLGGLQSVVRLLGHDDYEVHRKALASLCNLSINQKNKTELRDLHALSSVVSLLRNGDDKIRRDAMRAIRNLAFDDEAKSEIASLGAVPLIVSAAGSSDMFIARYAIRALSILSINAQNRAQIAENDGIRVVLRLLQSDDLEIKRAAVGTLINLSINKHHKETVRELAGLEPVLRCVSCSDRETVKYALRALYNLSLNEVNAAQLIVLGATSDVTQALSLDDIDSRVYALSTLSNFAAVPAGKVDLRKRNAIVQLVRQLDTFDERILVNAIKALTSLATGNDENLSIIRLDGGVTRLLRIAGAADDYPQVQLAALKALKLFISSSALEIVENGGIQTLATIIKRRSSGPDEIGICKVSNSIIKAISDISASLRREVDRIMEAYR